jgi:DNA-directed RNA polymerase specialized sigma24 family protein
MKAVEVLAEYDERLAALEARQDSLSRTLSVLEGLGRLFASYSRDAVVVGDSKVNLICDYQSQLEDLDTEIDNLVAAHRECLALLDRLEPKHNAILSYVHLAGHTVYEYAQHRGIQTSTAYSQYNQALKVLDNLLSTNDIKFIG